jgi:glycosyltransferase involved in cell wall biosynthesis
VGRWGAARGLLSGGHDPDSVLDAVQGLGADVVHAHNLHPLFGWRALAAAREAGARTVLHVHNFRLFCAIAVAYRDGAPCFRCHGRDTRPGLRLGCRGSVSEAAVYAAGLSLQQPRLFEHADRFIVLSEGTGARQLELGLPAERTTVLGNFVSEFAPGSRAAEGAYALAVGRLVDYKGFDTAIAAARAVGMPLVIAGEGPDESRLRELAAGADVRFAGWVDRDGLAALRARAAALLAPSRCEESCPYVALDAMADGVPVLVSDRGGMVERVPTGSALPAEDVSVWTAALGALWRDRELRGARGAEALELARELLSEDRYYEGLMGVYLGPDVTRV